MIEKIEQSGNYFQNCSIEVRPLKVDPIGVAMYLFVDLSTGTLKSDADYFDANIDSVVTKLLEYADMIHDAFSEIQQLLKEFDGGKNPRLLGIEMFKMRQIFVTSLLLHALCKGRIPESPHYKFNKTEELKSKDWSFI